MKLSNALKFGWGAFLFVLFFIGLTLRFYGLRGGPVTAYTWGDILHGLLFALIGISLLVHAAFPKFFPGLRFLVGERIKWMLLGLFSTFLGTFILILNVQRLISNCSVLLDCY